MHKNTPSFVYDRLYGQVPFTTEELKLFQTKELARLRHVSLSAIPNSITPTGNCASKFEHSVGVGHLARIVGKQAGFEEYGKNIYFAALAHDLGTPPFSHAAEYFQEMLLGKNHEEFVEDVFDKSEFVEVVKAQGGDPELILKMVMGKEPPLSDVVNGSIDIDNLDNTLRFGLSMGLLRDQWYSPERLANSYRFEDGVVTMAPGVWDEIEGWEKTRMHVYNFVYSLANMSTGMVLYRAMDLAYRENELSRDFFLLTDAEAYHYLLELCNPRTRELMDRAHRWIFYPEAFKYFNPTPSDTVKSLVGDWKKRGELADEIARLLGAEPEDVCVYMGKNKGYKKIHIPIFGKDKSVHEHQPMSELTHMVMVYVHPKWEGNEAKIYEYMKSILEIT